MRYQSFDPSPFRFPRARVDVLPGPSPASFQWRTDPLVSALLDDGGTRLYSRGRYALADAMRACGVGPRRSLLAPAYHCRTMIDPAIALGAEVVLFDLTADLQVDEARLHAAIARCAHPPAALLCPHYFGIERSMHAVRAWCDDHGIKLIEDCSHVLFLPGRAGSPERQGHCCVASPYKFFPMQEGGLLWTADAAAMPPRGERCRMHAGRLRPMARLARDAMSLRTAPDTAGLAADLAGLAPTRWRPEDDAVGQSDAPSALFDPAHMGLACDPVSVLAMRHTRVDRLCRRRRANYLRLAQAADGWARASALLPVLPDDAVPYMFPLLLERPERDFIALKQLGVPVWRWDDMAVSTCAVARRYRSSLLHLPCHQEMAVAHMDWLVTALSLVLADTRRGAA